MQLTEFLQFQESREVAEIVSWVRDFITENDHNDPHYASYKQWNWGWIDPQGRNYSARGMHLGVPILRQFGDEISMDQALDDSNATAISMSDELTDFGLRKGWLLYICPDNQPSFSARWLQRRFSLPAIKSLYQIVYDDTSSQRYVMNTTSYPDKTQVLQALWVLMKPSATPTAAQPMASVGESVTEGANTNSSALMQRVMNDASFTFGFEAEFVLEGVDQYVSRDMLKNAKQTKAGSLLKLTGMMSFNDLMRFWGPLVVSQDEVSLSNGETLKRRIASVYEDEIRELNQDDLNVGLSYRTMFDAIRNRMGLAATLSAIRAFPVSGFHTDPETNKVVKQAILYGDIDKAKQAERLDFPLFFINDDGKAERITMQHVSDMGDYDFFHLGEHDDDREPFLTDVAEDIGGKLAQKVNVSLVPDDNKRSSNGYSTWLLTQDGSVTHDNKSTAGLELISPASTLQQGFINLKKGFDVIANFPSKHEGVRTYTDKSTGLHLNLGMRNFDPNRFDPLKLAFLLGEDHLLKQFGRAGNSHALPMLGKIRNSIMVAHMRSQMNPSDSNLGVLSRDEVQSILGIDPSQMDRIKEALLNLMSTRDASGGKTYDKHVSINFRKLAKQGFIEFRITGNAGYEQRLPEITKIVYRYAILMLAASTSLYQNEYMTKLYKFLSQTLIRRVSWIPWP